MRPLKIALLQIAPCGGLEENLEKGIRACRKAKKMGADICTEERDAVITGVYPFKGGHVTAQDLRGGAALVVAALGAEGTSRISGLKYIRRGYDGLDTALRALGAEITTIL